MKKDLFNKLVECGIKKEEDAIGIIKAMANRLLDNLYLPSKENEFTTDKAKIDLYNLDNEAINWGDLKVIDVHKLDNIWQIEIDEAADGLCPNLCCYISNWLREWGWETQVKTEW